MKKYQIQNSIGSGNFSTVFKGINLPDQSPCAIKIMKSHHKIALREAQLLRKLKHPNVISIIDFEQNENESRLIMEYVGINTLQLYQSHSYGLRQEQVKCILFQVALGLSCVHSYGIIHRDIKPENILIDKKLAIVKLIDFGLAIDENQVSTDYIATRWYRAPENLLGTKQYTCAIDVFSLGCVIVQLYLGSPLFPGQNNIDQIYKIFNILGYPTPSTWLRGYQKMAELGIRIGGHDRKTQIDLKSIMNPCDPRLVDIVQKMLQLNPRNRITCTDILKHQYFKDIKAIIPPGVFKRYEQDFVINKPLSFKGFQHAKSSKNSSNQITRKFPQINFHNVSSKVKSPQNQAPSQNNLKVVEKPQFLRQKKSSSLDSCLVNQSSQSINQKDKVLLNPTTKVSVAAAANPQLNNQAMNRKFSTPSLVSYLNFPEFLHKNHTSAIQTKPKQNIQEAMKKNINDIKINIEMITQEQNHSKTASTIVPESCQMNAPVFSQPYLSKKLSPNTLESQQKSYRPFFIPENARNTYPFIPNVQVIQDQPQQNMYKIPLRMMSPPVNMSYTNNDQSFNSSMNYNEEQKKSPPNFVLKPFQLNQNFQKAHVPQQMDHSMNSKIYRSFEGQSHQNYIQNLVKQDLNKRAKNMQSPTIHPLQPITPRQNYVSPPLNSIRRQQQTTSRPQIIYRSPNSAQMQNKPFLSPTHRFTGNTSPDNSFNMNRQRRIVAVNSPTIQPPTPFFSPTHRKF